MSSKIKKKERELGRVDRSQGRKMRGHTVRCVNCHALNIKSAEKCWKCGEDLNA